MPVAQTELPKRAAVLAENLTDFLARVAEISLAFSQDSRDSDDLRIDCLLTAKSISPTASSFRLRETPATLPPFLAFELAFIPAVFRT